MVPALTEINQLGVTMSLSLPPNRFKPFSLTFNVKTPEQAQALWFYLNTSENAIEEVNREYDTDALLDPDALTCIEDAWTSLDDTLEDQILIPTRRILKQSTRKKHDGLDLRNQDHVDKSTPLPGLIDSRI